MAAVQLSPGSADAHPFDDPVDPVDGREDGREGSGAREAKNRLRALIRDERRRRSPRERRRAAQGLRDVFLELPQVHGARTVAVYLPDPGEPDTGLLRAALVARGIPVLPAAALPAAALADVDILVMPALAVDTEGRRLGRGRDGYDRLVRTVGGRPLLVAVVHDSEVFDAAVEALPEEPHDVTIAAVLTPTRLLYLPRGLLEGWGLF